VNGSFNAQDIRGCVVTCGVFLGSMLVIVPASASANLPTVLVIGDSQARLHPELVRYAKRFDNALSDLGFLPRGIYSRTARSKAGGLEILLILVQ
jgi:hypothetical protein